MAAAASATSPRPLPSAPQRKRHARAVALGPGLLLRPPLPADLPEISALVAGLVPRHIGGAATEEGLRHLRAYMEPGAIGTRLTGVAYPPRNPTLVACSDHGIVGDGTVRNDTHLSQF